MGLFDRFRAVANNNEGKADTVERDALVLIEQGNALEDEGRLVQALERYQAALRLAPNLARAHLNVGNVLLEHENAEGALAAYATALALDPDYAAAHFNMGNAYLRSGMKDLALIAYTKAIESKSDFVDAEVARSNVFNDLGRLGDAAESYRRVLQFGPDDAKIHYRLGNLLIRLGRLDEATSCFRRALELKPDHVEALGSLGSVLQDLGQLQDAAASYRRAIELKPDYFEMYGNLGNVLRDLGQFEEAVACYRRVLKIQPGSAVAHSNLGAALNDLGRLDEAMLSFRRALDLDPSLAMALHNMGRLLKDAGQFDHAEACYRGALKVDPEYVEACSNLLFLHNYRANQPAAVSFSDAQFFGEVAARRARSYTAWSNTPDPARCLRVGFLSGDLCDHPVGHFLVGVLAALASQSPKRLELYAYHNNLRHDEVTDRIKAHCSGWHSVVGLSDETLAQRIRDDAIDILIDLSGHTAHNRLPLFAWKPAPVQASWLGYLATTGVKAIDYMVADAWTLPETAEPNFTERIWRLPESYLCFAPPANTVEVGPLPASSKGHITFGSFNNLAKMNEDVVALWARVLIAVPNSQLFLKSRQLHDGLAQQNVRERFARHGVDGGRLILEGLVPRAEYLKPFQRLDIALDPFPYPGITTSVECLWMGVPVLTLAGDSFLSRQGIGLLMNAGLPEWIAGDADEYVARAVAHAGNWPLLAVLRERLRPQVLASPIFDAPRFAHHFEVAMRGMWQQWCDHAPSGPS